METIIKNIHKKSMKTKVLKAVIYVIFKFVVVQIACFSKILSDPQLICLVPG